MSAKKTVRYIQNNFRLTTKLLSDSNILPVKKVLLKNNFPTYELPLHNPNSRPKKRKVNTDCPPCPPIERECPEPEYQGQSSRWAESSRLHPRSKWQQPKQELDSSEIFGNSILDESDYVDNTDWEDIDVEKIKKNLESGKLTPQVENIISKYGKNVVSPIINSQNISTKETFDTIEFSKLIGLRIDFTENVKNKDIYSLFEKTYNQKPEKYLKQIQESVELILVEESRYTANLRETKDAFNKILSLYNNQPVLNVRTSESVAKQAYSTPISLGFLISNYLDLKNNSVYEPCAGNGSLTITAKANNVTACEIDPIRVKHLLHLGFNVIKFSALDPATRVILQGFGKFKRIVMNPPFGSYPSNQHIKINGRAITDIDQAIAIHSLQFLEPNGIAAIILGGHNLKVDKYGGYKANDQFFLNHIYRNFDVIKNIDINGDLYRKQGTSFDIRLIILRNSNTKEFKHVLPYDYSDKPGQILKANTWEDLYNILTKEETFEINNDEELRKVIERDAFISGNNFNKTIVTQELADSKNANEFADRLEYFSKEKKVIPYNDKTKKLIQSIRNLGSKFTGVEFQKFINIALSELGLQESIYDESVYSKSAATHEKGETNEQQNNQSHTSNSREASRELDSERQRERIQADERDSGDRRNKGQGIANNKSNDTKRDRNPDTQHETDEHGNRGYDSNARRVGVPGRLDSSDPSPGVIDEEKFRKFAEFLKKAGL